MLEKCTLSLLQVVDDLCYRWEDNSAADTCSETLELLMTHLCWAVDEPHQENTDQAPTYLGLTITSDHSMAGPWWNKSETRSWWSQVKPDVFLAYDLDQESAELCFHPRMPADNPGMKNVWRRWKGGIWNLRWWLNVLDCLAGWEHLFQTTLKI